MLLLRLLTGDFSTLLKFHMYGQTSCEHASTHVGLNAGNPEILFHLLV